MISLLRLLPGRLKVLLRRQKFFLTCFLALFLYILLQSQYLPVQQVDNASKSNSTIATDGENLLAPHSVERISYPAIDATLDQIYPPIADPKIMYRHNREALRDYLLCSETGNCSENQKKIVLLGSFQLRLAMQEKFVGGEAVWVNSTRDALLANGYTVLYTAHEKDDMDEVLKIYQHFPDAVKLVMVETMQLDLCTSAGNCLQSAQSPKGIPLWKIVVFHLWHGSRHPYGSKFTLSIEPLNDNYYLGYSLENECNSLKVIPQSQRKDQVFVLGKHAKYYSQPSMAWSQDDFTSIAQNFSLEFVGTTCRRTGGPDVPIELKSLGFMNQDAFLDAVAHSKVMLGIGRPRISPSPWQALCLGVPFINPVKRTNPADPSNQLKWTTQHDTTRILSPPYVYHVQAGDSEALMDAFQKILENPIDRFIPEHMLFSSMQNRVAYLVDRDGKKLALKKKQSKLS